MRASNQPQFDASEEAPAARGRRKRSKTTVAARGRRYAKAEKAAIMKLVDAGSIERAVEHHGVTLNTIARWQKERERRAVVAAPASASPVRTPRPYARDVAIEAVVPAPRAKKPRPFARDVAVLAPMLPEADRREAGIASPDDEGVNDPRRSLILRVWREHPGFGPSQVRNIIKRNGLRASVTTVRAIMEENGYVAPKHVPKEHTGRYEAARPRELYHLDFYHFHVHKQKQCLLFIEDDFSRFIVGWALVPVESADPVVTAFERCVERYGKPEAVMSDRGSAFHSWRGMSRFQALLEEYSVDFVLATVPQVNGKSEALNASFQKECLRQHEFADLTDAARVISRWIEHYNHQRTHHGLGGLLVPADRFYGLVERTQRLIAEGQGGSALDILNPDHRGLELFRVVSHGGEPSVYLMGRKILG